MLEIKIDSKAVDLAPDFTIDFSFFNPLFTESGFEDAYSYSFSLLRTARNKSFLEKKKEVQVSISYGGFEFVTGIGSVKSKNTEFAVDFKTTSLNLSQLLTDLMLTELELPIVPVADVSLNAVQKIDAWVDHMTQTTITDPVNEGPYKFPTIQVIDRTLSSSSSDFAEIRDRNVYGGGGVNIYADGVYVKNLGVVSGGIGWFNSASPCIRLQWLFEKVCEKLNITISVNELLSVTEFKQLLHFSGLSMDFVEDYLSKSYNSFGTDIDLNLFVPKLSAISLFNLFEELFGAFYLYKNNSLNIRLKKNILQQKAVDLSRYCSPEYDNEQEDAINFRYNYDIDIKEKWAQFDGLIWHKYVSREVVPGLFEPINVEQITNHEAEVFGNENKKDEIVVSYIPLISETQNFSPKYPTVNVTDPIEFYYQLRSIFSLQNLYTISSHWNQSDFSKGGFESWYLCMCRGNYPVFRSDTPILDGIIPPDDYLTGTTVNRPFFTNLHQVDEVAGCTDFTQKFGTSSLYLNDTFSHLSIYKKSFIELMRNSDSVSKLFNLPIHKILEIISWENPNHLIQQKNLSFRGVVQEVSFALGLKQISPVMITYVVPKEINKSGFNSDFNTDFD